MSIPLFFPPPHYVKSLPRTETGNAYSLLSLCESIGIPCRASGDWVGRKVIIEFDTSIANLTITAEPGSQGSVQVTIPEKDRAHGNKIALAAMAYAMHDLVAKQSIVNQQWNKLAPKKGRPKTSRPKTNKERQQKLRRKQQLNQQATHPALRAGLVS